MSFKLRRLASLALLLCGGTIATPTIAFNPDGHHTIGAIADRQIAERIRHLCEQVLRRACAQCQVLLVCRCGGCR